MRRTVILLIVVAFLSGCVHCTNDMRVGEAKATLSCVTYGNDLTWKQVTELLGEADCYPRPEPGSSLTVNTRLYEKAVVIFSTRLKEIQEGDKTRFVEAVTGVEICRPK